MRKAARQHCRSWWRRPPARDDERSVGDDPRSVDADPLLRALKAADPAAGPEFDDWAASEAGREVYARILSRLEEPAPRPLGQSRRVPRALFAVAAALVVIAAVVAGIVVAVNGSHDEVAGSTTTTAVAEPVDRIEALQVVVALAAASRGIERPQGQEDSPESSQRLARALGIVTDAELSGFSAGATVDRATLALWIWRGLGDRLTEVIAEPADITALSEDTRAAVTHAVAAGMLDLTSAGLFEPDRVIVSHDLEQVTARANALLDLKP